MPRCCQPPANEFEPCYASVLLFGRDGLEAAVRDAESGRLASCFTAWCPRCYGAYLVTADLDAFPCPSAHHTHKLHLLRQLREAGIYFAGS